MAFLQYVTFFLGISIGCIVGLILIWHIGDQIYSDTVDTSIINTPITVLGVFIGVSLGAVVNLGGLSAVYDQPEKKIEQSTK